MNKGQTSNKNNPGRKAGTEVSKSNTPQAKDDNFVVDSSQQVHTLDLLANDKGGKAKSLWTIDSGFTSTNGATITLNSDGTVSYDASTLNSSFLSQIDALTAGESVVDSFGYAIRLGNGTLSWATATVELSGVNDAPALIAGSGMAAEDGAAISIELSALGNDPDADDNGTTLIYTISADPEEGSASIVGSSLVFNPGNDFQYLAKGETTDVVIGISATDSHGASATSDVTFTVTGSNDKPVISDGVFTGEIAAQLEVGEVVLLETSGVISFEDRDLNDLHIASVHIGVAIDDDIYLGTLDVQVSSSVDGNGSNGELSWTYTLDTSVMPWLASSLANNPDRPQKQTFYVELEDQQGGRVGEYVEIFIVGVATVGVATDY